jgi:hypothetical protein
LTGFRKSERGRFNKRGAAMHQHAITIEQLANISEQLEVFGRVEEGPVRTMIGKHPSLGSCVVLQGRMPELVLLSEAPFDGQLTASENA